MAILAIYFRSPPLFVSTPRQLRQIHLSPVCQICLSSLYTKINIPRHPSRLSSLPPTESSSPPPPPSPCRAALPAAANAAPCSSSAPAAPTANTSNAPTASKSLHILTSLVAWCQTRHQRHTNTPRISRHQRRRAIPDTRDPIYTKTRAIIPHHKSPWRHKHLNTRRRDDFTGQRRRES